MIFEKDIIGIIDKYIGRYCLTKLNIDYRTIIEIENNENVLYNKITTKRYNFRNMKHPYRWNNIYNKYANVVQRLPKNY